MRSGSVVAYGSLNTGFHFVNESMDKIIFFVLEKQMHATKSIITCNYNSRTTRITFDPEFGFLFRRQ